jgi:hypothetical protein
LNSIIQTFDELHEALDMDANGEVESPQAEGIISYQQVSGVRLMNISFVA